MDYGLIPPPSQYRPIRDGRPQARTKIMQISLRQATVEDTGAIRDLLTERDGVPWRDEAVRWLFFHLDPARCVAWIAFDKDRPVGFTGMFLRTLLWQGQPIPVGYWTNLYVSPGYSGTMLYPRLPLAMFAWMRNQPLAFLYAAVRRQRVAKAHRVIGFAKIGDLRTQFYILRPLHLVMKQIGLRPWSWPAAAPVDAAFRGVLSLGSLPWRRLPPGTPESLNPHLAAELLALLKEDAGQQIMQAWTSESLQYRYRQTTDEEQYHCLGARDEGQLVAAVIFRCATHRTGTRVTAIMEAFCRPHAQRRLQGLVAEVISFANRRRCEMVLNMAVPNTSVQTALRRCGFRTTPIRYQLLIWPADALQKYPFCGDVANWRFSLGDHDAF